MKEAYVSFETAKLLKEKGFDWECTSHFDSSHMECSNTPMNFNSGKHWVSRPTHQMACAWLREIHNIFITIYCGRNVYCDEPYFRATWQRLDDEPMEYPIGDCDYSYYETCVEAALKYSLENLI